MADEILPEIMATGCLPQPISTRTGIDLYTGVLIPPSQYKSTRVLAQYVPRGKCQSSVPACNWYSTVKAYQTVFAMRTGKPYPELSYCANYQIATNGDFDAGTMPLDAIKQISQQGIVPVGPDCPEWFNRPRQISAELMQRRSIFRGLGWEECRTAGQVISATINTDPVNIGIDWFAEDVNPGPSGFIGVNGRLIGGHSVLAIGVEMGYKYSPSGIGIVFSNHHGDKLTPAFKDERGNTLQFPVWGDDGIGIVPIERVAAGIVKYGAFSLRSIMLTADMLGDLPTPNFSQAA